MTSRTMPMAALALWGALAGCGDPPGLKLPDAGGGPVDPDPNRCRSSDFTCVRAADSRTVSALGTPFDANSQDQASGPDDWAPQYGAAPEYIAHASADGTVDLVWLDNTADSGRAFHFQLVPRAKGTAGYSIGRAFELVNAGRVLGFTRDEKSDLYYYATSISEDLSVEMTINKQHRPDIVHLIQYGGDGKIHKNWDLGVMRGMQYPDSLPLYSPMTASTSRILYGAGKIATLFGVNTEIDPSLMRRHQMARYMELDVARDHIDREAGIWVSHSFDQRLAFDSLGFIELHLGDAFPRDVVLARHLVGDAAGMAINALAIKGKQGDNNTFSRLGGLARVADATWLVLFVTESNDGTTPVGGSMLVAGARNLGVARVLVDTQMADDSFGVPYDVTATDMAGKATPVESHVAWLTTSSDPDMQVERPRIAHLGPDKNVVLYEQWTRQPGAGYAFEGTQALLIDDGGNVVTTGGTLAHPHARLPRGDDLYAAGGRAVWFNGDAANKVIYLHSLDANLALRSTQIP